MSTEINTADILAQVNAEVTGMSPDNLKAELLKFRVRQKVQQKKNQGGAKQKEYQQKQREKFKAMKEAAIKLGLWDTIEQDAATQAEAKLQADAADTVEDENETATAV
jgi:hypothetical protein